MIYLIHLDRRLGHAGHYLGWTKDEDEYVKRQARHLNGHGAKLLRAARRAGIGWRVIRTWPDGDKALERRLKRQGGLSRHCPVCRATGEYHR